MRAIAKARITALACVGATLVAWARLPMPDVHGRFRVGGHPGYVPALVLGALLIGVPFAILGGAWLGRLATTASYRLLALAQAALAIALGGAALLWFFSTNEMWPSLSYADIVEPALAFALTGAAALALWTRHDAVKLARTP